MAVSDQQVIEALRPVSDPESGVGIVDLGVVAGIRVRRGRVTVTIAVPPGTSPLGRTFPAVRAAVAALGGVKDVQVEASIMTPREADALRARQAALAVGPAAAPAAAGPPAAPGAGPARIPVAPSREQGAGPPGRQGAAAPGRQGAAPGQQGAGDHRHAPAPARGAAPLGHEEGRANPFGPRSATRVIGITSGKGGVGKSSVTVNLAVSLVRAGHRVAVLDADVYGFSVPKMLGIDDDPAVRNEKMIPPSAFGVGCMSMGFFVEDDQPVIWRGPMLHKALEQFLVDVDWGEPDFLLVDMPPGTGDVALSMAQYLPTSEVYVVTTPQPAAKRVAQRSATMAKKIHLPLRGVIENMSWFTADDGTRYELFGRGGGAQLADELGVPLLGQVPLVPALRHGGDVGLPVTVSDPDGEAAQAFAAVATALAGRGRARIFHPELTIQ